MNWMNEWMDCFSLNDWFMLCAPHQIGVSPDELTDDNMLALDVNFIFIIVIALHEMSRLSYFVDFQFSCHDYIYYVLPWCVVMWYKFQLVISFREFDVPLNCVGFVYSNIIINHSSTHKVMIMAILKLCSGNL